MNNKIKRLFSKIPTLKTERLILRKLNTDDYIDMYEYACKPEVTEYLLWSPHESLTHTRSYLQSLQPIYRRGEYYDWGIEERYSGKMIGTCGYTEISPSNLRAEVGYVLNPEYCGKGYATEAVMAVIQFAFEELGINRVEARYMTGNGKSLAVMKRCGMGEEGLLREFMLVKGAFRDIGICSITKSEFMPNMRLEVEKRSRQIFGIKR